MSGWTKQKKHLKAIRQMRNLKKEQYFSEEPNNDEQYYDEQYEEQYNGEQYEEQINEGQYNGEQYEEQYNGEIHHLNIKTQCNLNKRPSYVQCAFATLMAGQSYSSSNEYNIHMNRKFVSKTAFYEGQKIVAKAVEQYSNESMKNALDATEDDVILSGDGRYPIHRNSPHCTFDIMNTQSNKVIALGVADKQSIYHPEETFTSMSNMLETQAMNRALKAISPIKDKVSGFVIDGDNKNRGLLEQENYSLIRDPNHLILNFNNYLDKELMKYKKMIPKIPDCFRDLRKKN